LQGGVAARYGPVSLTLAPLFFWAQNRGFDLLPNGRSGRLAFADPVSPGSIDLPQRFGDSPYARLDPGQSTLRVDLPFLAAGVSTADQYWGPALVHPLVLGTTPPASRTSSWGAPGRSASGWGGCTPGRC